MIFLCRFIHNVITNLSRTTELKIVFAKMKGGLCLCGKKRATYLTFICSGDTLSGENCEKRLILENVAFKTFNSDRKIINLITNISFRYYKK